MGFNEMVGKIRKVLRLPFDRFIEKVWERILAHSPFAAMLEHILGAARHEQLTRCVSLRYWPDVTDPESFNEKILRRKLFTQNNLFYRVADKVEVREYVREKVGEEVLNEVFIITDQPVRLRLETLPNQFVAKSSHGSGQNLIVEDKASISEEEIRKTCANWLTVNPAKEKREYWYQKEGAQIIVEKLLRGQHQKIPRDYKLFVFNGNVQVIEVDFDRFDKHTRTLYTREWKLIECSYKFPRGPEVKYPERLNEMIRVAETLGEDFDFVRVDLYDTPNGGIIFGEMTLAPEAGGGKFQPMSYDFEIGQLWRMEEKC
ncbi:hypothetical protein GGQ21_002684 [Salinibacter ruber]|jgi:hypothetical protein|uniref:ATP-grasp fold amidoligase family protein n=1 Tax=Salinibacter ruber TaxID=146919 RepID=UPI002073C454|nr:ATP-grasp fold amidoligase family protein [Salinibacter ruber]MCS3672014.1 hypothetical protein [Salinibacter ruber]